MPRGTITPERMLLSSPPWSLHSSQSPSPPPSSPAPPLELYSYRAFPCPGKLLIITVHLPKPSDINAGKPIFRYHHDRSGRDAFEYSGTIQPANAALYLNRLLRSYAVRLLMMCEFVHDSGALHGGKCRICEDAIPQLLESLSLRTPQSPDWIRRVLVPELSLASRSCSNSLHWKRHVTELVTVSRELCCFLSEEQFEVERELWEPIMKSHTGKSFEELHDERVTEEALDWERDEAFKDLFEGNYDKSVVYAEEYAFPDDMPWQGETDSAFNGDDEL